MLTRKSGTAVVLIMALGMRLLSIAQSNATPRWIGTWSTSPMLADGGFRVHAFNAVTLREITHISIGGKELRIRFTNEFARAENGCR